MVRLIENVSSFGSIWFVLSPSLEAQKWLMIKNGGVFVCKSLDKLITAVLLCITSIPRLCAVMLVVVANTKGITNSWINAGRKSSLLVISVNNTLYNCSYVVKWLMTSNI